MTLAPGGAPRPPATLFAEVEAVTRLELLGAVSRLLSRAVEDYVPALTDVAEACVPDFCDLCAIELHGDGGDDETVYRWRRRPA